MARKVLYELYQTGCEACEGQKPILDEFEREYGAFVEIIRIDLTAEEWPEAGKLYTLQPPDGIPAWVVIDEPGARPRTIDGRTLSLQELIRWTGVPSKTIQVLK